MNEKTNDARPVLLTDDELERLVAGLCEQVVERRNFAVRIRSAAFFRGEGAKQAADAAGAEALAAGTLMNRLSLELSRRRAAERADDGATLAAMETCSECGGRGGRHESDCDLRPLDA